MQRTCSMSSDASSESDGESNIHRMQSGITAMVVQQVHGVAGCGCLEIDNRAVRKNSVIR